MLMSSIHSLINIHSILLIKREKKKPTQPFVLCNELWNSPLIHSLSSHTSQHPLGKPASFRKATMLDLYLYFLRTTFLMTHTTILTVMLRADIVLAPHYSVKTTELMWGLSSAKPVAWTSGEKKKQQANETILPGSSSVNQWVQF